MKFFLRLSIVLSVVLVIAGSASAQVRLPEFSISNIPTIEFDEEGVAVDYEVAFSKILNPIMRDTLRLQYQINLLERLIRRQTEIQRIADSYQKIGIPFKQPAPPETSCEQLPVNVLCMAFYPNMTKYKNLLNERYQEASQDHMRNLEQIVIDMDVAPSEDESIPEQRNRQTSIAQISRRQSNPVESYSWTDIRCLAGQCSALIVDSEDSDMRIRVRQGDELPKGGTIESISVAGVIAEADGKKFKLGAESVDLASSRTSSVQPSNEISSILNDTLGDGANASEAMQAINNENKDSGAIPPQTVSSDTPSVLGVTGLF